MARYRKVDSRIWNDAKFRALSDNGKLAFFMLLTHPNMTALGGMRTTVSGLAEELGWPTEAFREAFREVLQKGMAKQDERACLVVLPNFLRYNQPESPNVVIAWASALDLLPECPLKSELIEQVKGYLEGLSEAFREAFRKAFAKSMPYQEPEQEQEQEKEKDSATCVAVTEPGPSKSPCRCKDKWEPYAEEAWRYYLDLCGRGPAYEFTKKRRALAIVGLQSCASFAAKHGASAEPARALVLMKIAIDRLHESPFHNGANDQHKKYLDFEQLFSSRTFPTPTKLTDFWLDDEKWGAA